MSMATGSDVVDVCGIDQLASGLKAGVIVYIVPPDNIA